MIHSVKYSYLITLTMQKQSVYILIIVSLLFFSGCLEKASLEDIELINISCQEPTMFDTCKIDCEITYKNKGDAQDIFVVMDIHEADTVRHLQVAQIDWKKHVKKGQTTTDKKNIFAVIDCALIKKYEYKVRFLSSKPGSFDSPMPYKNTANVCQGISNDNVKSKCFQKVAYQVLSDASCKAVPTTVYARQCSKELKPLLAKNTECEKASGADIETCYKELEVLRKEKIDKTKNVKK